MEKKRIDDENSLKSLENKFKTYYSRILFFSFLTETNVSSLSEIIQNNEDFENARILRNLDIDINILNLMIRYMNPFILSSLDYKIQNINKLSHDESVPAIERAITAMGKFGKLSESEVTTPIPVALEIISLIPDVVFKSLSTENLILDISSKMGEFAIAICQKCNKLGISNSKIRDSIFSICTSDVAYEFTRKIYKILGLNINCIAKEFNSFDLLSIVTDDNVIDYSLVNKIIGKSEDSKSKTQDAENLEDKEFMKFNAIVGNPPYHKDDGGAGASAKPIYPEFVNISRNLSPSFISLIIPTRWNTGGKGGKEMDAFRLSMLNDNHIKELHDCLHPEEYFPDTNNRGGVCYFLWDKDYDSTDEGTTVVTHGDNKETTTVKDSLKLLVSIFLYATMQQ